ncbi:uncharacterized protein LODBEIA_P50550 [Lodderomyces beijingensis]|uniref:CAP-Gly domain-containing protein n=1 Tax=Lodderomyces beijingensis TaxID=1775926 RepID=A0ABP0ZV00_9ASCO
MTKYEINDRISTVDNSQTATIRYIGQIPQWGTKTLAYGVEWDDASRGKNNGDLEGIQYFQPLVPNSGSFIKSTNKNFTWSRRTFVQAIREIYLDAEYQNREIQIGTKIVGEFGWEKLNRYYSDLRNLKSLSLDRALIYKAYNDDEEAELANVIFEQLRNLHTLDLSSNLFADFNEIWKIVSRLPSLRELNLNGNRSSSLEVSGPVTTTCLHHLKKLKLASTASSPDPIPDINTLIRRFPSVEDLILSSNRLCDEHLTRLELSSLASLQSLDLSYNELQNIPHEINIENLNLSHNSIKPVPDGTSRLEGNGTVKSLDMRCNNISHWSQIDLLSQIYPNLTKLRINHNPVFQDLSIDEMTIQLIARFTCGKDHLKNLNGTNLTQEEIENAELYFISKVQSRDFRLASEGRWQYLLHKYNKRDDFSNESSTTVRPWITLNLKLENANSTVMRKRRFLKSTTILSFRGFISSSMLQNSSILDFEVYFYTNEGTEFATAHTMKNYLSTLNDYALAENQIIHITTTITLSESI